METVKKTTRFFFFHACSLALVALWTAASFAALKTSDEKLEIDLPAGYAAIKQEDNPDLLLKAEQGSNSVTITTLNQDVSDSMLQNRLKDDIENLRAKGYKPSGETGKLPIHGDRTFFYTTYSAEGKRVAVGYFTYKENSYVLSATGLGEAELGDAIYALRVPGEKVAPRPKPKPVKLPKAAPPPSKDIAAVPLIEGDGTVKEPPKPEAKAAAPEPAPATPASTATASAQPAVETAPAPAVVQPQTPPPPPPKPVLPPVVERSPLPFWIWIIIGAAWFTMRGKAQKKFTGLPYPKLPPLPKDIPPDFHFPFIIRKVETGPDLYYSIMSRHGQHLTAQYNKGHHSLVVSSLYGLLAFHALWSLANAAGFAQKIVTALLGFPGGRYIVSFPEVIFIGALITGIVLSAKRDEKITMNDPKDNAMLMEAFPHMGSILLKDGKGKEVARIKQDPAAGPGVWEFVDSEGQYVFELKNEHSDLLSARKLYGNMGGLLSSRYALYVKDRLAGFILNDGADSFQIHFDFAFMRLANPAQIVMCVLYVETLNRDFRYPWFK